MMQNLFAKHLGRGASGPRRHQGRRRLVRHQGAHLCRRDGDGGAVEAAQAPGQVRRDPYRELRHRHPCPRSRVKAKIGVKTDGTITAWRSTISPASGRTRSIRAPPASRRTRSSISPAGLHLPELPRRARVVFQNKNVMCQYRAVGHPIATAVTEGLVEMAAQIGMDPLEIRRRNLIPDDAHPSTPRPDQVRGAVAPRIARPSRCHDELRRPARGRSGCASGASIAASALRASSR